MASRLSRPPVVTRRGKAKREYKKRATSLKGKHCPVMKFPYRAYKPGVQTILSLRLKDMSVLQRKWSLIDKSQPHIPSHPIYKAKRVKTHTEKGANEKNSTVRGNHGTGFTFWFVRNDLLKCGWDTAWHNQRQPERETGRKRSSISHSLSFKCLLMPPGLSFIHSDLSGRALPASAAPECSYGSSWEHSLPVTKPWKWNIFSQSSFLISHLERRQQNCNSIANSEKPKWIGNQISP